MVLFSAKKKKKERQGFLKIVFLILLFSFLLLFTGKPVYVFFFISIEDRRKALKIVVGELSIR